MTDCAAVNWLSHTSSCMLYSTGYNRSFGKDPQATFFENICQAGQFTAMSLSFFVPNSLSFSSFLTFSLFSKNSIIFFVHSFFFLSLFFFKQKTLSLPLHTAFSSPVGLFFSSIVFILSLPPLTFKSLFWSSVLFFVLFFLFQIVFRLYF